MKTIKIFITSSIVEFQVDRVEIGNFFRKLNDCYKDHGLYFQLIMSEDINNAIVLGRKQEEYNREIQGSDLVFFLFFTKTGQYTLEEFNVAMESFQKTSKPTIITYFKMEDVQSPTEEVARFMDKLDKEIGHYYNTYGHIDSLKLGMMMQIKQLGLDGMDVQLKDGRAMQGSTELLALEHVEAVSGHDGLHKKKEELLKLKTEFFAIKANYLENPDDNDAYEAFFEHSKKMNELKKSLEETEASLYSAMENMYREIAKGGLSQKQIEAYRLMERGRTKEAEEILNFDEILKESRFDEMQADTAAARAQIHVNELLQLIDIKATRADWQGMDNCYKEIMRMEERHNLPKNGMLAYVGFLVAQRRRAEGIEIAEKIRHYFEFPGANVMDEQKGELFSQLGALYSGAYQFADAESALLSSLDIQEKLNNDSTTRLANVALVCNSLALLYRRMSRTKDSEEMHKKALEIRKMLAVQNPDTFNLALSGSYNNLGVLYWDAKRYEEAEAMHLSALEIRKKQTKLDQDVYEQRLTQSYNNLSEVYRDTGRYSQAEELLKESLNIRVRLAEFNPDRYEILLALNYQNLGSFYKKSGQLKESENAFIEAIKIQTRQIMRAPGLNERQLADSYYNLGSLYIDDVRVDEARDMLNKALQLYEKYAPVHKKCAEQAEKVKQALDNLQK